MCRFIIAEIGAEEETNATSAWNWLKLPSSPLPHFSSANYFSCCCLNFVRKVHLVSGGFSSCTDLLSDMEAIFSPLSSGNQYLFLVWQSAAQIASSFSSNLHPFRRKKAFKARVLSQHKVSLISCNWISSRSPVSQFGPNTRFLLVFQNSWWKVNFYKCSASEILWKCLPEIFSSFPSSRNLLKSFEGRNGERSSGKLTN